MRVLRVATLVVATLLAAGGQQAALAGDGPAQVHDSAPEVISKVERALERGAKAAAAGIERGLKAAEVGVRTGIAAAARGIERGAHAAGRAAERVARELERALPPPPPAGSERTGDTPGQARHGHGDA